MRDTTGVTVGKFYPFHKGHEHLIREAMKEVDDLTVIVGYRPGETYTGVRRAQWIRDTFPGLRVIPTLDDLPEAPKPWADKILNMMPNPDYAFTSEAYGPAWAEAMGAEHRTVDIDRKAFPISGTEIRENLYENWEWLAPATKADLALRVVLVGAESTGTTTLTKDLARAYETVWVPEYGRSWWESRRYLYNQDWTEADFRQIVDGQTASEDTLAKFANRVLFCDTDPLATMVFEERYRGATSRYTKRISETRVPDLYIVTGAEIPWLQDGARESNDERQWMQNDMRSLVTERHTVNVEISGTPLERLYRASKVIAPLLGQRMTTMAAQ